MSEQVTINTGRNLTASDYEKLGRTFATILNTSETVRRTLAGSATPSLGFPENRPDPGDDAFSVRSIVQANPLLSVLPY